MTKLHEWRDRSGERALLEAGKHSAAISMSGVQFIDKGQARALAAALLQWAGEPVPQTVEGEVVR